MFGDVQLTESHEPRDHVLVGQLQDPHGVPLLNGGVVCVEVLQEGQKVLQRSVWDLDLKRKGDRDIIMALYNCASTIIMMLKLEYHGFCPFVSLLYTNSIPHV